MALTKLSPKTQNLIGCGVITAILLIGVVSYGLWSVYSFFKNINTSAETPLPEELQQARVVTGGDFLVKAEVFKLSDEPYAQTIGKSVLISDEKERAKIVASSTARRFHNFSDLRLCGGELIAAGKFGAFAFDLEGKFKREILFKPTTEKIKIWWFEHNTYKQNLNHLQIVELKKNEPCGFIAYDSVAGATIYNDKGNIIWNYGKENSDLSELWAEKSDDAEEDKYVLAATVGDLDGDESSEFIVAVNNDGVHAFNSSGSQKWFQPDDFPNGEFLITNLNSAENWLVKCGSRSKILDKNGNIVKSLKANDRCFVIKAEDGNNRLQFVDLNDNRLTLSNEDGAEILQADAPLSNIKLKEPRKVDVPFHSELSFTEDSESVYKPECIWANLQDGKDKYLAVVGDFTGLPRAQFYIYDAKGKLVYQEILPESAETITVLPNRNKTESIVVGGKNTIWKYSAH